MLDIVAFETGTADGVFQVPELLIPEPAGV
jgi:hypothetical protein